MDGPMFYQWIFQRTTAVLDHYVAGGADKIAATLGPVAVSLFGIYVLLWAWAHLTNRIEEPVMDAAKRLITITFILALALNAGRYTEFVVNFVQKTPVAMASIVANDSTGTPSNEATTAKLLDGMLGKGFTLGDRAQKKAGVLHGDFGMYFVAISIYACAVLLTLAAAVLLLLAQVGMAVLLVLGPVFLLLLMFNTTKRFFELWLGQLVNFMLMYVLTVAVISLIFAWIGDYLNDMLKYPGVNSFADTAQLAIMCGIGVVFFRQIPTIASAIAGGIGLSTMGSFAAAMNPVRRLAGGLGGVGRKGLNTGARKAGSAAWNNQTSVAARRGMANAFRRKNTLARI